MLLKYKKLTCTYTLQDSGELNIPFYGARFIMTAESCLSVLMLVFSSLLAAFPTKKHTEHYKYTVADIQKTSVL